MRVGASWGTAFLDGTTAGFLALFGTDFAALALPVFLAGTDLLDGIAFSRFVHGSGSRVYR